MGQTAMRSRRALFVLLAVVAALLLSSGVALAATISCQANQDCLGTENDDILQGSSGNDYMFGRAGNDALQGLAGNNVLHGEGGNDNLSGGVNGDDLEGGRGRDQLIGGGGVDEYYFGPRWGKDVITDDTSTANVLRFQVMSPGGVFVSQSLTIRLTPGSGPEVKNKLKTTTINWEGYVIDEVFSGAGNDKITGNSFANYIYGGDGEDIIFGGAGNDEIAVLDGSGDDVVDCGENLIGFPDTDKVAYDPGDTVSSNCEEELPQK